jgi:hypothetical protein
LPNSTLNFPPQAAANFRLACRILRCSLRLLHNWTFEIVSAENTVGAKRDDFNITRSSCSFEPSFFRQHCAGRRGDELMFRHDDGSPWLRSNQAEPMRAAVRRAKIHSNITFHGLRHTWASQAVMAGVPLLLVAKNLGHTSTRMVEQHYGHLSDSYAIQAIRAHAPVYSPVTHELTAVAPHKPPQPQLDAPAGSATALRGPQGAVRVSDIRSSVCRRVPRNANQRCVDLAAGAITFEITNVRS